jgi:hypothetical protein
VSATRQGLALPCSNGGIVLSFEPVLLLNRLPHLRKGLFLLNMQIKDAFLVRLSVVHAKSCRLALSRSIWRAHGRCRPHNLCRRSRHRLTVTTRRRIVLHITRLPCRESGRTQVVVRYSRDWSIRKLYMQVKSRGLFDTVRSIRLLSCRILVSGMWGFELGQVDWHKVRQAPPRLKVHLQSYENTDGAGGQMSQGMQSKECMSRKRTEPRRTLCSMLRVAVRLWGSVTGHKA